MGATRKSSCRWKKQDWNPSLSAWPQRILIADKSAAWWQPFPTASNLQGPVDCHFFQSAWERWPWRKHQAFWKDSMGQSLRSSFLNYLELISACFLSLIFDIQNASHLWSTKINNDALRLVFLSCTWHFRIFGFRPDNGHWRSQPLPSKDLLNDLNDLNVCTLKRCEHVKIGTTQLGCYGVLSQQPIHFRKPSAQWRAAESPACDSGFLPLFGPVTVNTKATWRGG